MTERAKATRQANDVFSKKHQGSELFPIADSPVFSTSANPNVIHRKASCTCGGGCPACQAKSHDLTVSKPDDPAEIEADHMAEKVMRMPAGEVKPGFNTHNSPDTIHRICTTCGHEGKTVQRNALPSGSGASSQSPAHVQRAIGSGGRPLDREARSFFEPRLGYDLSSVRLYTGSAAEQSAGAIDAKAYTIGRAIVFGSGEYQPESESGRRLLAHELAHVVQRRTNHPDGIHRTPANKVSCANRTPLVIPGTGVSIADPVGVITAAENRANQMFDDVIAALDAGRQRILAGAPAAWPTITDALALGLQLMGLDPEDPAIWTAPAGTGRQSVPLLLRRLRMIRSTIGAGSFFFFCLGTGKTTLGGCAVTSGDICTDAEAATCAGEFFTAFCPDFWTQSAEMQAATLVHETSHNFATFIGHTGRFTNAECFARLIQVYAGVPVAEQRVDLCPDP